MKKINTLEISAKRWFQKSYGNTYHVVKAVVNEEEVVISDICYGYDNHFLTTAAILFTLFVVFQLFNAFNSRELGNASLFANLLRNKGYEVPEDNGKAYAMMAKFPCTVEDVKRKKDLTF